MTEAIDPTLLLKNAQLYRVGGCVRDYVLGQPSMDLDYVVVGSTPEAMLAAGFRQVGADFPVFLHPDTHDKWSWLPWFFGVFLAGRNAGGRFVSA